MRGRCKWCLAFSLAQRVSIAMHPGTALVASVFVSGMFGTVCFAQPSTGALHVSQNAKHEVIATVTGKVARCGLTALPGAPTFRISGQVVDVTQPVAGVACRADVPQGALRAYHAAINLGHLPPGDYTVNWSFPKLSTVYKIAP